MSAMGYNAYQRTQIATADRRQVIVLLYEGAISRLRQASQAIEEGDGDQRVLNINKTLDIIHFLRNSLDFEHGGEISQNLAALYDYVRDTVTLGSLENSTDKLGEAVHLLSTLLEAWRAIGRGPQATPEVLEERARTAVAAFASAG